MARKRKISFLARVRIKRRVAFKARGKKISFTARVPSKKRKRVTFLKRKKK